MKTKLVVGTAILAVALIGTSGWTAQAAQVSLPQVQGESPQQSKTVNGKVATVTDNFVTLNVKSDNGDPQTLEFSTDGNTKIEGKLAAGVTVLVEYHTNETGKNMATRIVVQTEK
jgi:hypothetical protein